jgi:phosphoenolpyruvate phosphomutase-like protein
VCTLPWLGFVPDDMASAPPGIGGPDTPATDIRKGGFVMPNAWDGLSALVLADAGFEALGTSSAAFAASLGRVDGRHAVSREEHIS